MKLERPSGMIVYRRSADEYTDMCQCLGLTESNYRADEATRVFWECVEKTQWAAKKSKWYTTGSE